MNLSRVSNPPKNRFKWSAGLNLETLNTILSGTIDIWAVRLYAPYRLNLLLLKGQRGVSNWPRLNFLTYPTCSLNFSVNILLVSVFLCNYYISNKKEPTFHDIVIFTTLNLLEQIELIQIMQIKLFHNLYRSSSEYVKKNKKLKYFYDWKLYSVDH